MTDPEGTVLRGLPGDNPLGFLAALGVQVALDDQGGHHRLHWTDDPIPRPVVSPALDFQDVANAALAVGSAWLDGPALDKAIEPCPRFRDQRPQLRTLSLLPACRGQSRQRRAKPSPVQQPPVFVRWRAPLTGASCSVR